MIGLLTKAGSYAVDLLAGSRLVPLAAVDTVSVGLPPYRCPYDFPPIASGDTVVIVSGWLHEMRERGFDLVQQVLLPLRDRFARIIGVDQADPFQLDFPDEVMSGMDVVLKVNGIYKDRDLYNYFVGSPTPDGCWTAKRHPRQDSYALSNLSKVRLSIPCFLGTSPASRRITRRFYCRSLCRRFFRAAMDQVVARLPTPLDIRRPPARTVHFFASLTHGQRAAAARLLRRSSLRWAGGITSVPLSVAGFGRVGLTRLSPEDRAQLTDQLASEGLLARPLNRIAYLHSMRRCKVVLSIAGYGELCFRMAEAWSNRRILVCQSLSHVETLYPLRSRENVIYCRPDLTDLIDILDDIECNLPKYIPVAEQGYRDWISWSNRSTELVREGFAPLFQA